MKERDIEERLNSISKKITPKNYNFYNKIKKEERTMYKNFKLIASTMAMIIFIFVGILFFNNNNKLTSVMIDVNPSIMLDIKNNNKIASCKSLNEDGTKTLAGLKLDNIDLNTGLHAIIGSMYKQGYITEVKNSILVSVEGKHDNNHIKLENDITNYINEILVGYNVSPSVLSQTVENDKTIENLANEFSISIGKTKIINEILKTNTKRTFEDLAKLSITELNLILNDQNKDKNSVTYNVTGNANTSEYITKEEAEKIALSNEKLSVTDVIYIHTEFDYDDGIMIYDIEFKTSNYECEYEVNAKTGVILDKEKEPEKNNDVKKEENVDNTTKITSKEAMNIALVNAELSENEVKDKDVEYEYEKRYKKYIYEVSFETKKYEYEYDIDAISGEILNSKKEVND